MAYAENIWFLPQAPVGQEGQQALVSQVPLWVQVDPVNARNIIRTFDTKHNQTQSTGHR